MKSEHMITGFTCW